MHSDHSARAAPPGVGPPTTAPRHELDVRPLLKAGHEPFGVIMRTLAELRPDEVLVLRAPFNPRPLHSVLHRRGYRHDVQKRGRRDFEVRYWQGVDATADSPRARAVGPSPPVAAEINVRGLQPPEPLERTLAALEVLDQGCALVQVNERVPALLIPILEERGYTYAIGEDRRGVIVTIWRGVA
jgi:uncharacterized protein (DUF2249 family)